MTILENKISINNVLSKSLTYALCFTFLIVCSNVKLYLPVAGVPITMHTFAIAMLGLLLPLRVSLPCFLVYLVEGFVGAPFFGVQLVFGGPTFGYLVGMIVSLVFLSYARKSKLPLLLIIVASSLIIWFFGVLHLQSLIGLKNAFLYGVAPFVVGDALKVMLSYSLIKAARKLKSPILF